MNVSGMRLILADLPDDMPVVGFWEGITKDVTRWAVADSGYYGKPFETDTLVLYVDHEPGSYHNYPWQATA